MVYSTADTGKRADHIRRVIEWGTKLILGVVGINLFRTEFLRVIALPREFNNQLYLVLLAATTLLTAGWIFVANKEFEIMCEFLDPNQMPSETLNWMAGIGIAGSLTILLYTARNPLWFGISYSAYMLLSVFGWKRVTSVMDGAIRESRQNLLGESKQKRQVYLRALDLLDSYYVRQANLPRVWTSLGLGLAGLIFSILGMSLVRTTLNTVAYFTFILSVLVFEVGLASKWRYRLYTQMHPVRNDKYNLDHSRHHERVRRVQQTPAESRGSRGRSR
jgi:hypothetical protein